MLEELEAEVEEKLRKKLKRAESAYIKARTQKETINCVNRGPQLAERIHVCKIGCCGTDGNTAGQCWNQKAQSCDEFRLAMSSEAIRQEFRDMDQGEIALRWPQLGELLWVVKKIRELRRKQRPDSKSASA